MDRTAPNPFLDDVFVDDAENLPGVEGIHGETLSKLEGAIRGFAAADSSGISFQSIGRTFLLTAPRAGYGKSHLIARVRDDSAEIATSFLLPFQPADSISWSTILDSIILQSKRSRDETNFLTVVGRHFLASMVLSGLDSGAIAESEFPADLERLKNDRSRFFTRNAPENLLDWTNEHCQRLAGALEDSEDFSPRGLENDSSFWARLFLARELGDQTAHERCLGLPEEEARRKCLQFLRISTSLRPVLLIVDGLEGFFASASAGLEIATIIAGIRDEVSRTITVLCLNEEVWDSIFENKLPSAYLDRLTGEYSRLNPISQEAAEELVVFRLRRIDIPGSAARRFWDQLSKTHRWETEKTELTPREVLRQARDLWADVGKDFEEEAEAADIENEEIYEVPLSELTDKAEFFADLQKNGLPEAEAETEPPAPSADEEPHEFEQPKPEPIPENPFFAATPQPTSEKLDGIESIIRDIRGTGSSVVSETAKAEDRIDPRPFPAIHAGPIAVKPARNGSSAKSHSPAPAPTPDRSVDKKTIDRLLRENHREILAGPPLSLDLVRLGKFLKAVGENHPGLSQSEEHLPGARSVCLRWMVRGQSVLLGFESPQNVYFWNHLLQQSLSSNDREKISAFSHSSQVFDSELFSTFGFSPAVIRGRIDPIEMSDEELALLYAADSVLAGFLGSDDAALAMQFITQQLDPSGAALDRPFE